MNFTPDNIQMLANLSDIFTSIVAFFGLIIAWWTLYIWKRSIDTLVALRKKDAKRNAYILAIEKTDSFATKIIPLWSSISENVSNTSISKNIEVIFDEKDIWIFFKIKNKDELFQDKEQINQVAEKIIEISNNFESFSMPFVCWAAAPEIAFPPLSQIYCEIAEELFKFLPLFVDYKNDTTVYRNMFQLYFIWKKLIIQNKLKESIKRDEERYASLTVGEIKQSDYL